MIDLTSALAPAVAMPTAAAVMPVAAGAAPGGPPGSFGQTLEAFLDAHDFTIGLPATIGRQGLADDGKDTPAASNDAADSADDDAGAVAPPVWLPSALLPIAPPPPPPPPADLTAALANVPSSAPAAAASGTPLRPPTPLPPSILADSVSATPPAADAAPPASLVADPTPTIPPAPPSPVALAAAAPAMVAAPVTPAAPPAAGAVPVIVQSIATALGREQAPTKGDTPAPRAAPSDSVLPTAPVSQPIAVSATPQPAGQVFAAAIAAATSWRDRAAQNGKRDPTDTAAQLGLAAPLQLADRAIVQATGDAGGSALDLTQDSGLHRMIDHIETLRDASGDAADARDTRIRLVPDALGSVDVSVRQEGDRIHVSFAAEQDATRALIADAQPRLTELAAQRGVRIGDTSVATDAGNSGAQQQARATPIIARAPSSAASDIETPSDDRVA